jgi:putative flavoprotein involved in K+ transport
LLGHVKDARNGQVIVAPDLKETLAKVDQAETDALKMIDDYVLRAGLKAPLETVAQLRDGYEQEVITELNLKAAGISTVIWATGYAFDFSLVKLPVVDADGYPIQKRGVTDYDGVYFLGMPWLDSRRSGILFGVGDDAAYLAAHIAARDKDFAEIRLSLADVPIFAYGQLQRSNFGNSAMNGQDDWQI